MTPSSSTPLPSDHDLDLLVQWVTEGLEPEESRELDRALADVPDAGRMRLEFELAAAEADLAWTHVDDPLPEHLAARAVASFAAAGGSSGALLQGPGAGGRAAERSGPNPVGGMFGRGFENPAPSRYLAWTGWAAALVACALLAVVMTRGDNRKPDSAGRVAELEPSVARELLLQEPGTIQVEWNANDAEYTDVEGDVVWNSDRQQGYLRLRGLQPNDPSRRQYQLWIVDPIRDPKHPVDGGVFDVPNTAEHVIPIDAKLEVIDPKVFAITQEKPGGAVVSEDSKLRVVAKRG